MFSCDSLTLTFAGADAPAGRGALEADPAAVGAATAAGAADPRAPEQREATTGAANEPWRLSLSNFPSPERLPKNSHFL